MKKIIIYTKIQESLLESLSEYFEISYYNDLDPPSLNSIFLKDLKNTNALLGSSLKIDRQLLNHAPSLQIVCNTSAGFDNLDIKELTKRNIMATNTPHVLTETTADAIFGLLIATARRIPELNNYVKEGKWKEKIDESLFGVDVHGKTVGIIGMGNVGSGVAYRCHHGFNMKILYHNRSRHRDLENKLNASHCNFDELLKQSDFICVTASLTSETKNLIGKREFALMKKSAVFINGSRGQIVNEGDLIVALKNKEIFACGLDVYQKEPIDYNNTLLDFDNVVTLPHIGSATLKTRNDMSKYAVNNLIKGLKGERPPSLINSELL